MLFHNTFKSPLNIIYTSSENGVQTKYSSRLQIFFKSNKMNHGT